MTPALQAAISRLGAEFALGPGRAVVDLGAGVGKRARLLVDTGARVIAIEPSPAVRAQLAAAVPNVEVVDGTPDEIPLPEWTADLVVVAEADVWLASEEAVTQVHRVLKPGAALALIGDPPPSTAQLQECFGSFEHHDSLGWCRKR